MRGVRGAGEKIKFRGIFRVVATERNGLRAHRQINAVNFSERKCFSVRDNFSRAADVDRAKFTSFEKKRAAGFTVVLQHDWLIGRHYAADNEAVEVGEMAARFARRKKAGDLKCVAQLLRGHTDHVLRTRRPADGIFKHDGSLTKKEPDDKQLRPVRGNF
jgi:hypothetical protein